MRKTALVSVLTTFLFTLGVSGVAHAQRFVVINGNLMSPAALAALDRTACQPIPNGYYWMDAGTGIWGFAGNPTPQGHISGGCRRARHQSLSERRMLYSPYDWVR